MNDVGEPIFFSALERLAKEHGSRAAIDGPAGPATFAELLDLARALEGSISDARGKRIGVHIEPSASWIAAMASLDRLPASAFLVSPELPAPEVHRIASGLKLHGILREAGLERLGPGGEAPGTTEGPRSLVTLLTSGTTGEPKPVQHGWGSLSRPVRVDAKFVGTRWLLAYPLHLYAGLQVFLQCFLNAGTLVLFPRDLSPADACEYLRERRVEYVSATPSFWRRLLSFGSPAALRRLTLGQITLGGEPATEDILRALRSTFPDARIVHIYATSETGRCFTVRDGKAGFPSKYLAEDPEPGISLRIVEGELQVRSANHMVGYDPLSPLEAPIQGWFPTGDLMEIAGDRVLFRGRKTDMINVGGNKVYPVEVESVIRQVEGVAEARVYPVPSSIAGELVAADIVAKPDRPADGLRQEVAAHCARSLQSHQRPRQIHMVPRLDLTLAGKIARRRA